MPTFLVLLLSMLCFACVQRQAQEGSRRGYLIAAGWLGLGASLVISATTSGVERGVAVWLASLMAAGIMAPFLATQVPRLQTVAQWSRVRVFGPLGQRVQASFK